MTLHQIMLVSSLLKRQLCLENDLHIANALCAGEAPLFSQFDESTQLIDRLVVAKQYSQTVASKSIGHNLNLAFFDVGPMFPCNKSHEAMKNCRN